MITMACISLPSATYLLNGGTPVVGAYAARDISSCHIGVIFFRGDAASISSTCVMPIFTSQSLTCSGASTHRCVRSDGGVRAVFFRVYRSMACVAVYDATTITPLRANARAPRWHHQRWLYGVVAYLYSSYSSPIVMAGGAARGDDNIYAINLLCSRLLYVVWFVGMPIMTAVNGVPTWRHRRRPASMPFLPWLPRRYLNGCWLA